MGGYHGLTLGVMWKRLTAAFAANPSSRQTLLWGEDHARLGSAVDSRGCSSHGNRDIFQCQKQPGATGTEPEVRGLHRSNQCNSYACSFSQFATTLHTCPAPVSARGGLVRRGNLACHDSQSRGVVVPWRVRSMRWWCGPRRSTEAFGDAT